jgi:hypothetical protein
VEGKRYQVIDGHWQPIITEEKFWLVQDILTRNLTSRRNVVAVRKKSFLLAGLMVCGRCTAEGAEKTKPVQMLTSSGTSKTGRSHYYYLCKNCKTSIPAGPVERLVQQKISELAQDPDRLRRLTEITNRIVLEEVPRLKNQLGDLQTHRRSRQDAFDRLFESTHRLDSGSAKAVLESKGEAIAREIEEIDKQIKLKEEEIAKQNTKEVDFQMIREGLINFADIFGDLSPYEQQQTVRYLVDHVVYTDSEMRIALDTGTYISATKRGVSESVLWDPQSAGWTRLELD